MSKGSSDEQISSESESGGEEAESEGGDAPRVSQWVDEDDEIDYEAIEPSRPRSIKDDLASLSFGALLKANKALAKEEENESGSDESASSDSSDDEDEEPVAETSKAGETLRKPKEKRANKHAPMEMSSKRPVSRKRMVVEVTPIKYRDPRFGDAAGEFSADHFRKDYTFLADVRSQELETLKQNLSRAKKLLASSPAHLREERGREVEKLERAVRRTESTIERSKREAFERDVLLKAKREERERRLQGKKAWYMKKADQKKMTLEAKFESMSGKEAKKAMEKRQKKMAQKDKRSRPFFGAVSSQRVSASAGVVGAGGTKHRSRIGGESRPKKRRRIDEE